MSNFVVSARKYRPDHFNSVVGQSHITRTLKTAIKTNQLAQAFLFCGPRGVGKTSCARILAKTINCTNISPDFEACDVCESCVSFRNGSSFNIHELDAASNNSVEDIRTLVEQVRYAPQAGKYKIYIIDEVHMLSSSAFNAFLKTLEEPPAYAIFILATTEKQKIIPTILSRCQIFEFHRIQVKDIASHLAYIAGQEAIKFEPEALHIIAQKADGALRDALSSFDQLSIFTDGNITYKEVIENLNILDYDYYFQVGDALLTENIPQALLIFDEILRNGFNGNDFMSGLCSHFRDLLVSKDQNTVKLLEVTEQTRVRYLEQSGRASLSFLLSALAIGNQCEINYRTSKNPRLQVELALMKMCHISSAFKFQSNPDKGPEKKNPELNRPLPLIADAMGGINLSANTVLQTAVKEDLKDKKVVVPQITSQVALPTGNMVEELVNKKLEKTVSAVIKSPLETCSEPVKISPDTSASAKDKIKLETTAAAMVSNTPESAFVATTVDITPESAFVATKVDITPESATSATVDTQKQITAEKQQVNKLEPPVIITTSVKPSSVKFKIPSAAELHKKFVPLGDEEPTEFLIEEIEDIRPIDFHLLVSNWKTYAHSPLVASKINVFTILTAYDPELEDGRFIKIKVENSFQRDIMQPEIPGLLRFLKDFFNHNSLYISVRIMEQAEEKTQALYSSQDRFAYLADKNPLINEFKSRLDLEIER